MEGALGQIIMFGGNFAPRNWALCEGQLLVISQNQALFSILGTMYGGDGRTTFGLPDFRGRVAIGTGNGPGLTDRREGAKGGTERTVLSVAQLPSHNHIASGTVQPRCVVGQGDETNPNGGFPASSPAGDIYGETPNNVMGESNVAVTVQHTGSGQALELMQPFLVVNFVICTNGTFPSRG